MTYNDREQWLYNEEFWELYGNATLNKILPQRPWTPVSPRLLKHDRASKNGFHTRACAEFAMDQVFAMSGALPSELIN